MSNTAIECDFCQDEFSPNDINVSEITAFVVCPGCREKEDEAQTEIDLDFFYRFMGFEDEEPTKFWGVFPKR